MSQIDCYHTVAADAETEIKIKGSKFIGRVFPCADEAEAEAILNRIRKQFYDATHNCYAWRVGLGKEIVYKYSDDGEPSGTAGRPIYDQLEGHDVTNAILIVTRYFGGTKLGTGGLTHAYSDSAAQTIEKAGVVECFITDTVTMVVAFSDYNAVERLIRQSGGMIVQSDFADVVTLTVEIRLSLMDWLRDDLIETTSGRVTFV
ncbi:MAG: YigZ family protein [candidate division Zixibacteria bacterium]|nr:YigZ family protein [candidate division Zixibacteria bacterium]